MVFMLTAPLAVTTREAAVAAASSGGSAMAWTSAVAEGVVECLQVASHSRQQPLHHFFAPRAAVLQKVLQTFHRVRGLK